MTRSLLAIVALLIACGGSVGVHTHELICPICQEGTASVLPLEDADAPDCWRCVRAQAPYSPCLTYYGNATGGSSTDLVTPEAPNIDRPAFDPLTSRGPPPSPHRC